LLSGGVFPFEEPVGCEDYEISNIEIQDLRKESNVLAIDILR
jgi:hypothetical protein